MPDDRRAGHHGKRRMHRAALRGNAQDQVGFDVNVFDQAGHLVMAMLDPQVHPPAVRIKEKPITRRHDAESLHMPKRPGKVARAQSVGQATRPMKCRVEINDLHADAPA